MLSATEKQHTLVQKVDTGQTGSEESASCGKVGKAGPRLIQENLLLKGANYLLNKPHALKQNENWLNKQGRAAQSVRQLGKKILMVRACTEPGVLKKEKEAHTFRD